MPRPRLEVSLYREPVLRLDLATVNAPHRIVTVSSDRFRYCTAAWLKDETPTQEAVTRWLLGIRPESGARRAQDVRARERLRNSQVFGQGYEGGQAEIIWALPGTEYAGAISFRSLDAQGETLQPRHTTRDPLTARTLDRLLDRIKREMAKGTIHPGDPGVPIPTSSGAMPKVALHLAQDGRWHLPRPPELQSTHILKIEDRPGAFPGEAFSEAVCQRTLRALGIRACATRATLIGTAREQVVISERSDRETDPKTGAMTPIHQEEWASACGGDPDDTYHQLGKPGGFADLYRFLMEHTVTRETERHHFWSALAATVLLGHRDLHKRNLGIRHSRKEEPWCVELAPLYDVSTIHGCSDAVWEHAPMPIHDEHRFTKVGAQAWTALAIESGEDPSFALSRLADAAKRLPDALSRARSISAEKDLAKDPRAAGRRLDELTRAVETRCEEIRRELPQTAETDREGQLTFAIQRAMSEGLTITATMDASTGRVEVHGTHPDREPTPLGKADSASDYYRMLADAGLVPPHDVPYRERTIERERHAELARAQERGITP